MASFLSGYFPIPFFFKKDRLLISLNSLTRHWLGALVSVLPGIGWLFAAALIPGVLAGSILFYDLYQIQRSQLEQGALQTARALSMAVDNDLAGINGKLQILATTPSLQAGELQVFYARAREVLTTESVGEAIVLTDATGQQIINTLLPFGTPLPMTGHPDMVHRTVKTGRPGISDLYLGGVARRPFVAVEVPVWSDGKVAHVLDMGISAERLNRLLVEQDLPEGWVAALLDSQGTIVARSHHAPSSVGKKATPDLLAQMKMHAEGTMASRTLEGVPSFVAFTRSHFSQWTVVIGMPRHVLYGSFHRPLMLAALTMMAFLLGGAILAVTLGRHIREALENLRAAAEAATRGDLNAQAPLSGPREIACLAQQFNRMQAARKHAEAQLRLSASVFSAAAEGIIIADREARIINVNQAFTELTGYLHEEVIGKNPRFLKSGKQAPDFYQAMFQSLESTGRWQGKLWNRRKDGALFAVYMTISVVRDDSGAVAHYVALFSDITDVHRRQEDVASLVMQRTAELAAAKLEAERANNAKSRFLAAASHDLRQPLAALSLYVASLESRLAESDPRLLADMRYCVGSLNEMLSDLLDLSKLDAGVVAPNISDFSLEASIAKVVSAHAPAAKLNGLAFRYRDCDVIGRTDRVLFQRILGNLVSNAIRYTEKGGVLIGCRRRQGRMWVEVWDTGMGIPADKTGEIFEEFKQLGNPERNMAKGTGLGLAIVARMAELLNLQISVRSRPGKGSVFAVELPLGAHLERPAFPRATLRPLRIVLVEDNAYVAAALSRALASVGHQVLTASSRSGVLPRLDGVAPDLVISDYRLVGEETGLDVIASFRTCFGSSLPAIIITGDMDPDVMRRIAEQGIGVQHKPLDLDALLTCIEELAGQSAA